MTATLTPGLSWNDVISRAEAQSKLNVDFYASPAHIKVADDGTLIAYDKKTRDARELGFTDLGLSQLSTKVGVPTTYARKLAESDPALLATNINRWLRALDPSKDLLIRATQKPSGLACRAVLSERYGILDNHEFIAAVADAFEKNGLVDKLTIKDLWLSDQSFHLRLTDQQNALDAAKLAYKNVDYATMRNELATGGARENDFLFPMLHLSNSEVGLASIKLEGGVYRVVCTNGLVAPVSGRANRDDESMFRRRHFGFDGNELREYVVEKAEDILRNANTLTETFAETQSETVEDPVDVIERLSAKHNVRKHDQQAIRDELGVATASRAVTKYDLINAITKTAQTHEPEERITLERIAAGLLSRN